MLASTITFVAIVDDTIRLSTRNVVAASWAASVAGASTLDSLSVAASKAWGRPLRVVVAKAAEPAAPAPVTTEPTVADHASTASEAPLEIDPFVGVVVGPCNEVAVGAARAAAIGLNAWSRTSWLHGPPGVGKSLLLRAAAQASGGRYTTCEEFTNDWIAALAQKEPERFRSRFSISGTLHAFDDVGFLVGKPRVQKEFEFTLERIDRAGSRAIMAAEKPPRSAGLEPRLQSLCDAAFTTLLAPPDPVTAGMIVRERLAARGVEADERSVAMMAAGRYKSVREIDGVVNQYVAASTLACMTRMAAAAAALSSVVGSEHDAKPEPSAVVAAVADKFGLKVADLQGEGRKGPVTLARHVAMDLLREACGLTLVDVGGWLGRRDHATVVYGLRRIEERRGMDEWHVAALDELRRKFGR